MEATTDLPVPPDEEPLAPADEEETESALPFEPDVSDGVEDGDDSVLTDNDPARPDGEAD